MRGRLELPNQIVDFDAKGIGDNFESLNGDVGFATLDFADVCAVQAGSVAEFILRPAVLEPKRADCSANLLLNILHSRAVWAYSG
jgi:hypothetical protein